MIVTRRRRRELLGIGNEEKGFLFFGDWNEKDWRVVENGNETARVGYRDGSGIVTRVMGNGNETDWESYGEGNEMAQDCSECSRVESTETFILVNFITRNEFFF